MRYKFKDLENFLNGITREKKKEKKNTFVETLNCWFVWVFFS